MASLFRAKIVRYVDSDGKRVKKTTPGAIRKNEQSSKWYGQYRDEREVIQRVPLSRDKSSAQAMLNEIVLKVERRKAGLTTELDEHAQRPLSEHLTEFLEFLEGKGDSEEHVDQTKRRLSRVLRECKFQRISDLNGVKLASWLKRLRTKHGRSIKTSNHYLGSARTFCNWLVNHERMEKNPFRSVKPLNANLDLRHSRRAISEQEFELLLKAAATGRSVEGISGKDREMLYILAAWTGFRRKELASLRTKDLQLDAEPPMIQLEARSSKRRKAESLPLHAAVVVRLKQWLPTRSLGPDDFVFPLRTESGKLRLTHKDDEARFGDCPKSLD